jgi:peptide/histidine transporter 3/4
MSVSTRLVVGMCLSAMSVILAGLLESERLFIIQSSPSENTVAQLIGNTTYYAADLNILWQIPPYTVIGLGEVFCSVCALYFAYSAAPKSMQSIIMGSFYFFSGLGSVFGLFALWSFKSQIFSSPENVDDINCATCHLNYYFYYLAVIQLIGIFLFIFIDWKFKIAVTTKSETANGGSDSVAAGGSVTTGDNLLYSNRLLDQPDDLNDNLIKNNTVNA